MANTGKWVIDPTHTEIAFKVKHLMISNVKGFFKEFSGEMLSGNDDFSGAEINFTLNTASVDTGVNDRDAHLRSADFFDAENHPAITFKSRTFEKNGSDEFILTGDFSIRGVTKELKMDVEFLGLAKDPWGNEKAAFTLSGKINRKDFGLTWNAALETGGVLVSDEVRINCEVQLVKQA